MHGLLRCHPAHGPGVELPELLPRLPPELHQEMGPIPGISGRRYSHQTTSGCFTTRFSSTNTQYGYLCEATKQQDLRMLHCNA